MRRSRKLRHVVLICHHQRISHGAIQTSLQKQLVPRGPIASGGDCVLVFFMANHIITCNFPEGVWTPGPLYPFCETEHIQKCMGLLIRFWYGSHIRSLQHICIAIKRKYSKTCPKRPIKNTKNWFSRSIIA